MSIAKALLARRRAFPTRVLDESPEEAPMEEMPIEEPLPVEEAAPTGPDIASIVRKHRFFSSKAEK